MHQRASQRKFGKGLKLHLAKQKKQKLEETWTNVCRREKCIEKENVCFEEARRESIKENEKKAADMSQDVCTRSLRQKQETRGWESLTNKTRSAKKTSAAEQKREQSKDACSPQNSSTLSSLAAHPTSSPSYSRGENKACYCSGSRR